MEYQQRPNTSALDSLRVTYSQSTADIDVVVSPAYLYKQSRPDQSMFAWSYEISIANRSMRRLQLISRHWIITDGRGIVEEHIGDGVVG